MKVKTNRPLLSSVPLQDEQRDSVVDTSEITDSLIHGINNVAEQIPDDAYHAGKGAGKDYLKSSSNSLNMNKALTLITLLLITLSLIAIGYFNFNTQQELKKIKKEAKEIKEELKKTGEELKPAGEKLCESLSIHSTDNDKLYHLYQPYLFVETPAKDARFIVSSATWKATNCKPKENGDYVLEGEDESTFTMEVLVNGKYEQINSRPYTYHSWVNIRKNGILQGRSYDQGRTYNDNNDSREKKFFHSRDEKVNAFINTKKKELKELRDQKHNNIQKQYCTSMQGEKDGNTMIAFVCDGYTRVMIKK
ncbi:MAG: hypothetical protein ACU4EQ_06530 [Candidatus Nitrosoglobus sp.]